MRIWEKRLLDELHNLKTLLPIDITCRLRLSWGPFYGGSVVMNRSGTKAKVFVQIPYDKYVTDDEKKVISQYQITCGGLPYFIFFHECFHLLDALAHIKHTNEELVTYQAYLNRAVRSSAEYRKLSFEASADEFAFQQYLKIGKEAG